MPLNKVVITGMGAVSPYGIGVPVFLEKLSAGQSAVVNMRDEWEPQLEDLMCYVGAPLAEGINEKAIPRKFRKTMGKTAVLAYFAAKEAIEHSGLNETHFNSGKVGVSFSSSTSIAP